MTGPADRILSWRQGIASSPSVDGGRRHSSKATSGSISPRRSVDQRSSNSIQHVNEIRKASGSNRVWSGWATNGKAADSTSALADMRVDTAKARAATDDKGAQGSDRSGSPRSVRDENPLLLSGGRSYMFWDTDEWKGRAERMHQSRADQLPLSTVASREDAEQDHLNIRPNLQRGATNVSRLSDEHSSASDYEDAPHEPSEGSGSANGQRSPGRNMLCRNCGGRSFSARRLKNGGTELVCSKCRTTF